MLRTLLVCSSVGVRGFDLRLLLGGIWQTIDEGHVGMVNQNGNLRDTVLPPGLHCRWLNGYTGEHLVQQTVMVDYDDYPVAWQPGVNDQDATEQTWIVAPSADMTPWAFRLRGGNQVLAADMVAVVRANGIDYDRKIGIQFRAAVLEVVGGLSDLEIRKHRAGELNELFQKKVQEEIRLNVPSGEKIHIRQVTIEGKKPLAPELAAYWANEVRETARASVEMARRTAELEVHATTKATSEAAIAILHGETAAENQRLLSVVLNEKKIAEVANEQLVLAARAEAEASRIRADGEIQIQRAIKEQIEEYKWAADHETRLAETAARHANNKETTYVLLPDTARLSTLGHLWPFR